MVYAFIDKGTGVQGHDRESLHGCASQWHGSLRQGGVEESNPMQRTPRGLSLLNHGIVGELLHLPEPQSPRVSHNGSDDSILGSSPQQRISTQTGQCLGKQLMEQEAAGTLF